MEFYNKQGRLALLLPVAANHDGALYTVEEIDEDGDPARRVHPRDFWAQLATKPEELIPRRNRELQTQELKAMLTQFQLQGPLRPTRREGDKDLGCVALPYTDNLNRKRLMRKQGLSVAEVEELVFKLPVLRLYAYPVRNSLVLFGGGAKTSKRWQDSEDVRAEAAEGNAIANALDRMLLNGDMAFEPRGFLDLNFCEEISW